MSPPSIVAPLPVMIRPFLKRTALSAAETQPDRQRERRAAAIPMAVVLGFIFFLLPRDPLGRELGGSGPSLDHRAAHPFPLHRGREEKVKVLAADGDRDLEGDVLSRNGAAGEIEGAEWSDQLAA